MNSFLSYDLFRKFRGKFTVFCREVALLVQRVIHENFKDENIYPELQDWRLYLNSKNFNAIQEIIRQECGDSLVPAEISAINYIFKDFLKPPSNYLEPQYSKYSELLSHIDFELEGYFPYHFNIFYNAEPSIEQYNSKEAVKKENCRYVVTDTPAYIYNLISISRYPLIDNFKSFLLDINQTSPQEILNFKPSEEKAVRLFEIYMLLYISELLKTFLETGKHPTEDLFNSSFNKIFTFDHPLVNYLLNNSLFFQLFSKVLTTRWNDFCKYSDFWRIFQNIKVFKIISGTDEEYDSLLVYSAWLHIGEMVKPTVVFYKSLADIRSLLNYLENIPLRKLFIEAVQGSVLYKEEIKDKLMRLVILEDLYYLGKIDFSTDIYPDKTKDYLSSKIIPELQRENTILFLLDHRTILPAVHDFKELKSKCDALRDHIQINMEQVLNQSVTLKIPDTVPKKVNATLGEIKNGVQATLDRTTVNTWLITLVDSDYKIRNEDDFNRLLKKLEKNIPWTDIPPEEIPAVTKALKMKLLAAQVFALEKKEKCVKLLKGLVTKVIPEMVINMLLDLFKK